MKKLKFFAASLGIMTLAACSNSDEVFNGANELAQLQNEDNAVSFSTYMGSSATTRAGVAGSITTASLKTGAHKEAGFGVFAYYTGTNTYGQQQGTTYTAETSPAANIAPNFMYNQQVKWNNSLADTYVTKWEYSPVKYWPNEVNASDVDDQDNDTNSDPATASDYGGNVSFFAYAPYVLSASGTEGITAMSTSSATGDPTVTYVVAAAGKDIVDLLWGAASGTSTNVNGEGNTGVTGDKTATANTYKKAVLNGYTTNADLTKQKTNGTVGFAFKHALSKVGGSTNDPSGSGLKNGLMVQLDIDDMKGGETGGSKDATTTKVTIKDVKIEALALLENGGKKPGEDGYVAKYLKTQNGTLNLATGVWTINEGDAGANVSTATDATASARTTAQGNATKTTLLITSDASLSSDKTNKSGEIATDLAEPSSWNATWASNTMNGVTTTPQNVYKSEATPLVYIPGTFPELTVTVDYLVRTKDDNLSTGYTQVEQKITKRITFTKAVELNKQYSLVMHLGLTSVKFTASVSDWTVNTEDPNFDSDNNGSNDIHVEEVHLPINVATLSVGSLSKTAGVSKEGETITLSDVKSGGVAVTSGATPVTITATQTGGTFADATLTGTVSSAGALSIVVPANTGSAATWTITNIKIGDTVWSGSLTFTQLGN